MAIEQYEKIIYLWPNAPRGYFLITKMYVADGQYSKSLKTLKQAYHMSPKHVEELIDLSDKIFKEKAYDQAGEVIKEMKETVDSGTMDLVGAGGLTTLHMLNFCNGIRKGESLNAPVADGFISNLLPHLGNIAQNYGRVLNTDPSNGHIIGDYEAASMWSRDYEDGWAPSL